VATQTTRTASGLVPYRLTVRQFLKMIEVNIFPEGHRVELLGGILSMMTTNDPHDFAVDGLADLLNPLLPAGWTLREEKSVQLGRSWRPQPEIAVLKSPRRAFASRAPRPTDIALLVEVADTSYVADSGIKLRRYAHVRVPNYWIVNLERRQVEVYSDPQGRHGKACYRKIELYPEDTDLPVIIEGKDLGRIPVKDILP
jgi:Uma2 family endonuclease